MSQDISETARHLFKTSNISALTNLQRTPPGNKTSWRRRNNVSLYVPVMSQVRLKSNTQRRLSETSARRLSGTAARRLIGMSG